MGCACVCFSVCVFQCIKILWRPTGGQGSAYPSAQASLHFCRVLAFLSEKPKKKGAGPKDRVQVEEGAVIDYCTHRFVMHVHCWLPPNQCTSTVRTLVIILYLFNSYN